MGNSRWRLEMALNYVAKNAHELGREDDVEVLVADWGSEIPLREVLQLSPAAAKIVSFVLIPGEIARVLQKDSPFPEVLALNAAARRVMGQYIGRIDQDTLVGKRFLTMFFKMHDGDEQLATALDTVLLFANRRCIPYRFAVRCPSFWVVDRFIRLFGPSLKIETSRPPVPFYLADVGIWLLHRNLWNECGGYDERMIYMNAMEPDMISRLIEKCKMVDLGKLVNYDFYHLEHYHPRGVRKSSSYRKTNREFCTQPNIFYPNSKDWGLIQYPLEVLPYGGKVETGACEQARAELARFLLLMVSAGAQFTWDSLILSLRAAHSHWTRRAGTAWDAIRGQPLVRWPSILRGLWSQRTVR